MSFEPVPRRVVDPKLVDSLAAFAERAFGRFDPTEYPFIRSLDTRKFVLDQLADERHTVHPLVRRVENGSPLIDNTYFGNPETPRVRTKRRSANEALRAQGPRGRTPPAGTGSQMPTVPPVVPKRPLNKTETIQLSGLMGKLFELHGFRVRARARVVVGLLREFEANLSAEQTAPVKRRMRLVCRLALERLKRNQVESRGQDDYINDALLNARQWARKWRRPDAVPLAAFLGRCVTSAISNDVRRSSITGSTPTGERTARPRFIELDAISGEHDELADLRTTDDEIEETDRNALGREAFLAFVAKDRDLVAVVMALERSTLKGSQYNHQQLAALTGFDIEKVRNIIKRMDSAVERFRMKVAKKAAS